MITFKSSFIKSVNIPKVKSRQKDSFQEGALVEFNPNSQRDYKILRSISRNWEDGNSYAVDVFDYFSTQRICRGRTFFPNHKYYGITKNTDTNSNSTSVLGVVNILEEEDKGTCTFAYLQVHPNHTYGAKNRKYKHIGELLIQSIIENSSARIFKAIPGNSKSKKFLEKLNFKSLPDSALMIFKR